ncbi:MAG: aspartate 1-decarboxylase [Candidatus Hydrothermales bacterium]
MYLKILKTKLHGLVVTDTNLNYEGSITLPESILDEAGINEYEAIYVVNLSNGKRFETYAIKGKEGEVILNGGTARLGIRGDKIIVFSFIYLEPLKAKTFKPKIFIFDENNRIIKKL